MPLCTVPQYTVTLSLKSCKMISVTEVENSLSTLVIDLKSSHKLPILLPNIIATKAYWGPEGDNAKTVG